MLLTLVLDVGVVFTERIQFEGGVKPSAESSDGQSHFIPTLDPNQQSTSSHTIPHSIPAKTQADVSSRPIRRHERTMSQTTNIFTGATIQEPQQEAIMESHEVTPEKVEKDVKPYSERRQFWESVTSQSFESKRSSIIKSETESDTDTGTDGTVVEKQKKQIKKTSEADSSDSEMDLPSKNKGSFYENVAFAGTEKIDLDVKSQVRAVSPFEVTREEQEVSQDLPSPEDVSLKDVKSKRQIFENEIKRQSMELEEQTWKRSSKEYDSDSISDDSSKTHKSPTESLSNKITTEEKTESKEASFVKSESSKSSSSTMEQIVESGTETKKEVSSVINETVHSKEDKIDKKTAIVIDKEVKKIGDSVKISEEKEEVKEQEQQHLDSTFKKQESSHEKEVVKVSLDSTSTSKTEIKDMKEEKEVVSELDKSTENQSERIEKTGKTSPISSIKSEVKVQNKTVTDIKQRDSRQSSRESFEKSSSLTTTSSGISDSQTSSFEKTESQVGSFETSRTDSSESRITSTDKTSSSYSPERKHSTQTSSMDDHEVSEVTEEDLTRTEETSDEDDGLITSRGKTSVEQNVMEEHRVLGDTHETVLRETTTTRDGAQEERVIKETKTQETLMADGSTVKTTSITTFTTQLNTTGEIPDEDNRIRSEIFSSELDDDTLESAPEEKNVYSSSDSKSEEFVKDRMKSDIFKQELSSLTDECSPEHKVLGVTESSSKSINVASVSKTISSPVHVPEEKIQDVVWETSQQLPDELESETVEEIPGDIIDKSQTNKKEPPTKPQRKTSHETVKIKLSEEEARSIALDIVEEVKNEALKRSPITTPLTEEKKLDFSKHTDSAFTLETSTKIDKYIKEQIGNDMSDENQIKLLEKVAARKTEILKKQLAGGSYQISMEITDEDLRSSGAELSPIEHQMERLRQMNEDDDGFKSSAREPSEADESESSIIIHDIDETFTTEYDQANEMFNKTLSNVSNIDIKGERVIDTIAEEIDEVNESTVESQHKKSICREEAEETAKQLVKEVTEKAQESEKIKSLIKPASTSEDHGSESKSKDVKEDSKKLVKEESIKHQRSLDSHKEHMETSMTESMEECSAAESIRAYESRMHTEVSRTVIHEGKESEISSKSSDSDKKEQDFEKISTTHEVIMRKKGHVEEFSKRSAADIDTCSSSGESHYTTAAEGTSDSRTGSRPCSSDVEALLSGTGTTGTSEYETALTSQEASQYSSVSQDYHTAASSISSRDSMKSIDSESSGNLASIELSEASETLVPSALELEKDMDLLDQEIIEEEEMNASITKKTTVIPQLRVQSETPKSENAPCTFDTESDELDSETVDEPVANISSKMKRSVEMTFHPEPRVLRDDDTPESQVIGEEQRTISESSSSTIIKHETTEVIHSSSDTGIITSTVSEKTQSSLDDSDSKQISRTDSGVLTVATSESNAELQSVTITATAVPSTIPGQTTGTVCTQVTSETKSDKNEENQFFRTNGPTEVDYEPEYDDDMTASRPVIVPSLVIEREGTLAGRSAGPVCEESYETEADQEYGQMVRESEFFEMAEAELQYSIEEQPESEISGLLGIEEPIERPRTPEPGYLPSSVPSQITIESPEESQELTEVDKQFSAVFSVTYDSEDDDANLDLPNITVTEHMSPIPQKLRYPDLEREEDFPECRAISDICSPGSPSSATSPKSSTTDSEQGREYCLESMSQERTKGGFDSFEMLESSEIDSNEYTETIKLHEQRLKEILKNKNKEDKPLKLSNIDETQPLVLPPTIKAIKIDNQSISSSDTQSLEGELDETFDSEFSPAIEEQRRWLEQQFEESSQQDITVYDYTQQTFMDHVYSGPLEDIEEEKEDVERRDMTHLAKTSSLSSTPEYDVLAGKKFFTKSGEHDDTISMSSLQEFERLEREIAIDSAIRRSSSGSQESLNGKRTSKSTQGDDISVGSFSSLKEFELLENECKIVEQIETKVEKEEAMLSEIEEGHESQVSESESCEGMSDAEKESDGESYDQQLFEIDEIIRQAQRNVQKFNGRSPSSEYQGVQLKDIVSATGSAEDSIEEKRYSLETKRQNSQDSLEKDKSKSNDIMTSSVDSLEYGSKQDPMTASTDSLENRKKKVEPMTCSTDSIEPCRRDLMTTSADSLGRDDSSGRDADVSSGSENVGRFKEGGIMEWSTDSLEPSSSQATHATYQYETDSIMSGSFTSGCSNTLLASTDDATDLMSASMYIPEGELPDDETMFTRYTQRKDGTTFEMVKDIDHSGYSHTVKRTVSLPPEVREVHFKGPDSQRKLEEFMEKFDSGEHTREDETIDAHGNVHVQRVVQKRMVIDPSNTKDFGFVLDDPTLEESVKTDEHGNIMRVVKRTVVSTETMEFDLDTGEPITGYEDDTLTPTASPKNKASGQSRIPVLSTRSPKLSSKISSTSSLKTSSSRPSGPSLGSCGPREPLPPSLEPNTISGTGSHGLCCTAQGGVCIRTLHSCALDFFQHAVSA